MDLSTTWLGLELPHPLIVGASPIVDDFDLVRRAEDAGAAAIVMHSLFEEQIELENITHDAIGAHGNSFAEAATFLPKPHEFVLGPDAYLEQIRKLKKAVAIPVIASLNGATNAGWLHYAKLIEDAGADALELNVYTVGHDPEKTSMDIEQGVVDMVRRVVRETSLPVAVKLSPQWTSLTHFARELEAAGARGLVLFNRFYQPDIDPEHLDVAMRLHLSDSTELPLRLRWLALLSGRLSLSLAASGGVHTGLDAVKTVMAGAHAVQLVSSLLAHGPEHLAVVREQLTKWLEDHEYQSLRQAQGSMNLSRCPRPEMYERGNYIKILQGYTRMML
ncbi:MAG: dihydroorotate dehydrogenase-like protein [Planctomycetes bacterium]|nr:dihydroorotate dehydrogenase-like protein [Planctomycetota bacterium]